MAANFPDLSKARLYRRYRVGDYMFLEWDGVPSNGVFNYHFILQVGSFDRKSTVLVITSEITTKAYRQSMHANIEKGFGKEVADENVTDETPFMEVYHPDGVRQNLGSSASWLLKDTFFKAARDVARKNIGLQGLKVVINKSDLWMFQPKDDDVLLLKNLISAPHEPVSTNKIASTNNDFLIKLLNNWYFVAFILIALAYCSYHSNETPEQKNFMLGCLSKHNETFCKRLWERNNKKQL